MYFYTAFTLIETITFTRKVTTNSGKGVEPDRLVIPKLVHDLRQ